MSDLDIRISARVKARQTALSVVDLAEESYPTEDQYGCRLALWSDIRDYALSQAPLPKVKPVVVKARPMTAEQAKEFEKETMQFGAHSGFRVGEIVVIKDSYLRWLANMTFIDDLRRYLAYVDGE